MGVAWGGRERDLGAEAGGRGRAGGLGWGGSPGGYLLSLAHLSLTAEGSVIKSAALRGQVGLGMVAGGYLLSAYCTSGP